MTRLLLALLLLPSVALAAADPVTVETKWVQKTFSISTTGVTSLTIDIGGFGSVGYAKPGSTYRANGVDGTTYGLVTNVTTNTTNVIGASYSVLPIGSSVAFTIAQTLRTPPPLSASQGGVFYSTKVTAGNSPFPGAYNFSVPQISTSSSITVPNSVPWTDSFQAQTENPVFAFPTLTPSATLYFSCDYFVPRPQ